MEINLSEKDWGELENRFPSAFNFMVARSVRNEFEYLSGLASRNHWQENRLKELSILFVDSNENVH